MYKKNNFLFVININNLKKLSYILLKVKADNGSLITATDLGFPDIVATYDDCTLRVHSIEVTFFQ